MRSAERCAGEVALRGERSAWCGVGGAVRRPEDADRFDRPMTGPTRERVMSQSSNSTAYGFIGAGEITAAIVEGLHAQDAEPPAVFLSPRGHAVAGELAARFPGVQVCQSNQDVLDRATSIVLAVPLPVAQDVLEQLSFRAEHVLLSAVAGLRLHQLRDSAARAGSLVRTIPLPQAAHRQSLTTIYPDDTAARALFERVGGVLVADDEQSLDAFGAVTATFAAHLDYLATIADWLADQGIDRATATGFTTHIFGQLGISLAQHENALATMTGKHATPGGNNERLMAELRSEGMPDAVRRALDHVFDRLRS
ncbi:NAD(P)-binding domain-containing protein [Saccharopolyspora sp. SCSIO 74807]|uniref:NAD(P)-binding domain-containing protein n=1 Tax=Saccharopolyspora sp. SCSIO 74807 TaxID=3118084 RepID=UPI0030D490BA